MDNSDRGRTPTRKLKVVLPEDVEKLNEQELRELEGKLRTQVDTLFNDFDQAEWHTKTLMVAGLGRDSHPIKGEITLALGFLVKCNAEFVRRKLKPPTDLRLLHELAVRRTGENAERVFTALFGLNNPKPPTPKPRPKNSKRRL